MQLVLLSGGTGTRLWPVSNSARAKQFIKVLKNGEGQFESMAQRVWRQLRIKGLAEHTIIACSQNQSDHIISQLGSEAGYICEPEKRDTFPAIALACTYLHSIKKADESQVIIVAPIDSYVNDSFYDCFNELEQLLTRGAGEIGLIGISPTSPSSSYGYMIPLPYSGCTNSFQIERFVEKPEHIIAERIIKQGALWNSGVFAFKLGFMLNLLDSQGFPTEYENLHINYKSLPKISFDYKVLEKTSDMIAVKYNEEWLDLGTWNSLSKQLTPFTGKGIMSSNSKNSHVYNELSIPVVALGISDLVVAASPDGILVADKNACANLKEYISELPQRPMFEERNWGWYHVLDHAQSLDGYEILTKKLHLLAGKNLSYQVHDMRVEVWTITSGNGLFACNDTIYPVKCGDVLHIPSGTKHGLKAITDLELIEVQSGINLIEEDITRIYLTWEETLRHCNFVSKPM